LGFAHALLVIAMRLAGNTPIAGFSALIVVLALSARTQLIVTGLIGKYLWRVLEEVGPRPPFIVDERLKVQPQ
jgi:hypothetical protein